MVAPALGGTAGERAESERTRSNGGGAYVFFQADLPGEVLAWGVPVMPGGGAPVVAVETDGLRFVRTVEELAVEERGVTMRWGRGRVLADVEGRESFNFPNYRVVDHEGPLEERVITGHERLVVDEIWRGVDLVLYSDEGGLRYDLELEPGVAPSVIGFETNVGFEIDEHGGLSFDTEFGALSQTPPLSYLRENRGEPGLLSAAAIDVIDSRFVEKAGGALGFQVNRSDGGGTLVIDPGIYWSSYIGGDADDWVRGMAFIDDQRFVFGGQSITKNGFPVIAGAFPWSDGSEGYEGFVVGVNTRTGQPLFSLLIGGDGNDGVYWVGVDDATDDIFLLVGSSSSDFPVAPSVEPWFESGSILMRLDMDVPALVFSESIPGPANMSIVTDLALGSAGGLYGAGWVFVQSEPYHATPGSASTVPIVEVPFNPQSNVIISPFASRIDSDTGKVVWRTFVDGPYEFISIAPNGPLIMGGAALVDDHHTPPNAYQRAPAASATSFNAFIHTLSADGATALAATYFGVPQGAFLAGVGARMDGSVYLGGSTTEGAFPTTAGTYSPDFVSGLDNFIVRMDKDLSVIEAATLIGAPDPGVISGNGATAFAVDASGVGTLHGGVPSSTYPETPGAKSPSEYRSFYFTRVSPDLDRLLFSATFGFSQATGSGDAIEFGPSGQAMIGASTNKVTLETVPTSAFPTLKPGHTAGYVTGLDMLPIGVWSYGTSSSPCGRPIALGVDRAPVAGDASFSMYAMQAIPNAVSVLVVSGFDDPIGAPAIGLTSYIDLSKPLHWSVVPGPDASGFQIFPLPIPAQLAGKELFAQIAYLDLGACGLPGTWGASNALRLQVQ